MTNTFNTSVTCQCGAYTATTAALKGMSNQQRQAFYQKIADCPTCRNDKHNWPDIELKEPKE